MSLSSARGSTAVAIAEMTHGSKTAGAPWPLPGQEAGSRVVSLAAAVLRRVVMAQVVASQLRAFQRVFTGKVITPDDQEYETARSVWNGAIDRRPALIARCSVPAEVVQAIRFGREQALEISVRGGGHN